MNFGLGFKRDIPDQRDIYYELGERGTLPVSVDLRPNCPPIYNQGKLGSCTANAVSSALDYQRKKQGEDFLFPSRLFIYYNTRLLEGTEDSDAGASIRDTIKEIVRRGACPETEWSYDIDMFDEPPPISCYKDAIKYEAIKYKRLEQSELALKSVLAAGYTFVCGISVYKSFMKLKHGVAGLPKPTETLLGGHAQEYVGYKEINGRLYFIGKNSWGIKWGLDGFYFMPAEYLLNPDLACDFWALELVK